MCGISCFAGQNAIENSLLGLRALSYRGYDSFGFAAAEKNRLFVQKKIGKVEDFSLQEKKESCLCISHTRWATHGIVSEANAHPHVSCDGKIAVVHNGIIENFSSLKHELEKKGHCFKSETDTEVIPHLIEEFQNHGASFQTAFRKTLKLLEGKFAIAAICAGEEKILAATNSPPLVIGLGKGFNFLSSDSNAFLKKTNKAIFLEKKQIASIGADSVEIFGSVGKKKIVPKTEYLDWNYCDATKGDFEHFMLKEIFEQPLAVQRTIDSALALKFSSKKLFAGIKKIVFVACGTSYYAGLIAERFFEQIAFIDAECEYASEFVYKKPLLSKHTLVIAISQSGETADTLEAVRIAKAHGARILSIVNAEHSTIAKQSDFVLPIQAGAEIGVASTKAFTCFLAALFIVALSAAIERKKVSRTKKKFFLRELEVISSKMQSVLSCSEQIKKLALGFSRSNNALFLGRGINYPIALEGALKLKEISYIHAEGYPAAEMKHGPIALIDEKMPVFFIALNDSQYGKIVSNIQEVRARKGQIVSIATENDSNIKQFSGSVIFVPQTIEFLSPLLSVLPLQLLAYHIAKARNCNIDKPRNLAKSVTVE